MADVESESEQEEAIGGLQNQMRFSCCSAVCGRSGPGQVRSGQVGLRLAVGKIKKRGLRLLDNWNLGGMWMVVSS